MWWKKLFGDWTTLDIVRWIVRIIVHLVTAIFNPLNSFGSDHTSINLFTGTLITGDLDYHNVVIIPDVIELVSFHTNITVTFNMMKMTVDVMIGNITMDFNMSKSCVDYWREIRSYVDEDSPIGKIGNGIGSNQKNSNSGSNSTNSPPPKSSAKSNKDSSTPWWKSLIPAVSLTLKTLFISINDQEVDATVENLVVQARITPKLQEAKVNLGSIALRARQVQQHSAVVRESPEILASAPGDTMMEVMAVKSVVFQLNGNLVPSTSSSPITNKTTVNFLVGDIFLSFEEELHLLLEYFAILGYSRQWSPSAIKYHHDRHWQNLTAKLNKHFTTSELNGCIADQEEPDLLYYDCVFVPVENVTGDNSSEKNYHVVILDCKINRIAVLFHRKTTSEEEGLVIFNIGVAVCTETPAPNILDPQSSVTKFEAEVYSIAMTQIVESSVYSDVLSDPLIKCSFKQLAESVVEVNHSNQQQILPSAQNTILPIKCSNSLQLSMKKLKLDIPTLCLVKLLRGLNGIATVPRMMHLATRRTSVVPAKFRIPKQERWTEFSILVEGVVIRLLTKGVCTDHNTIIPCEYGLTCEIGELSTSNDQSGTLNLAGANICVWSLKDSNGSAGKNNSVETIPKSSDSFINELELKKLVEIGPMAVKNSSWRCNEWNQTCFVSVSSTSQFQNFFDWNNWASSISSSSNEPAMSITLKSIEITAKKDELFNLGVIVGNMSYSPIDRLKSTSPYQMFELCAVQCPSMSFSRKLRIEIESVTCHVIHEDPQHSIYPEESCYRYVYRIFDDNRFVIENNQLGNLWSDLQVFIGGPLRISLRKEFRSSPIIPNKLLIQVKGAHSIDGEDDWRPKSILFAVRRTLGESHFHSTNNWLLGFFTASTKLEIAEATVAVDVKDLGGILTSIRMFNRGQKIGYNAAFKEKCFQGDQDLVFPSFHEYHVAHPTGVMQICVQKLKATIFHLFKPVISISCRNFSYGNANYTNTVKQLTISLASLIASELSADYAKHKVIIDSFDSNTPNRLELIISSRIGEMGMMEAYAEHLRVMYLQRATMTLVSLFRDYFFADIGMFAADEMVRKLSRQPPYYQPQYGMFRLCALFKKCEVHLPMNSCSSEAITIIFHHLHLYRRNDQMNEAGLSSTYCLGPLLERNIWLSEAMNIDRFSRLSFNPAASSSGSSVIPSNIVWKLSSHRSDLRCPYRQAFNHCQSYIHVDLFDASICTWCNDSYVCSGQDITCKIQIYPANPNSDEPDYETILSDEFDGEVEIYDIAPAETRNTIIVSVDADSVDWMLTQGQYWAIVNMIQQNFCELQEHVIDVFPLPTLDFVKDLGEEIYGRYSLNTRLALVNTVPINIKRGKIVGAKNEDEFYARFLNQMPTEDPEVCDCDFYHDIDREFRVWIPATGCHHRHREYLLNHKWSSGNKKSDRGNKDTSSTNFVNDIHDLDTPFAIVFEKLYCDFNRKHFGGGNGIEVSADSFIIAASESDVRPDGVDDDLVSQDSASFDDVTEKNVVFAPKHSSILNRPFIPSSTHRPAANLTPEPSPVGKRKPHIRYHQQGNANLRRCIVEIDDSAFVLHFCTIMAIVDFFHTPIRVISDRNLKWIEEMGKGPLDFRAGIDVEVHLHDTVICLPNIVGADDEANALCFRTHLDYLHTWRGFLQAGPGKVGVQVNSSILGTFIAPINEVQQAQIQNLVDPVYIQFHTDLMCLPSAAMAKKNIDIVSPWIRFGTWIHEHHGFDRTSCKRLMKLNIYPLSSLRTVNSQGSSGDFQQQQQNDEDEEKVISCRNRTSSAGETDVNRDTIGANSTTSEINEEEEDTKVEKGLVSGQCSLKDVEFIVSVIECLSKGLRRHIKRVPEVDVFQEIAVTTLDIRHCPPLTYFLLPTEAGLGTRVDVKQFTGDICRFQFHVRNNTYNLQLVRLELSDICMMYDRIPTNWHMAASVRAVMWSYNDIIDEWEPLIEPIEMRAIGATDTTSKGTVVASLLDSSKIRVEVQTDALEINASQQALQSLIKKIKLNDVVTTSSQRLPPYKLINELGVQVKFNIGFDGLNVIDKEISPGETLPIEVMELSEALNSYKRRRQYNLAGVTGGPNGNVQANKEYLLWISFQNFRDTYESNNFLSIDKVGMMPFEMKIATPNEKESTSKMFSWLGFGGGGGNKQDDTILAAESNAAVDETSTSNGPPAIINPAVVGTATVISNSVGTPNTSASHQYATTQQKFVQEIPLALLDMKIKGDGVRELHLKSILSFKNTTSRVFQIALHLYGSSTEVSLAPGKEWNVPVRFANPKASLFFRFDRSPWMEVASSLSNFISQGYWGAPQRLRADLTMCPPEYHDDTNPDGKWCVLMRPEAKYMKSPSGSSSLSNKTVIPVRYPTRDTFIRSAAKANTSTAAVLMNLERDGMTTGEDFLPMALASAANNTSSGSSNAMKTKLVGIRPLCIYLQAPLQLCNLLPQPILYRLADMDGNVFGTGMILPGQIIDIHSLNQLYQSKVFISIRLVNYGWSKWSMLFSRTHPFSVNEKSTDLTLSSLHFNDIKDSLTGNSASVSTSNSAKEFTLPTLDISMSVKEFLVRFSCQLIISNSSGIDLLFAEGSSTESFVPISTSKSTIEKAVDNVMEDNAQAIAVRKTLVKQYTKRSILNEDDDDDGSDDSEDEDDRTSMMSEPSVPLGKIQIVTVHLPHDHRKKIEVPAAGNWTLADLFFNMKHRVSSLVAHSEPADYMFLPWKLERQSTKTSVQDLQEGGGNGDEIAADTSDSKGKRILLCFLKIVNFVFLLDKNKQRSEIPEFMKFNMVVDLSSEVFLMTNNIEKLNCRELVLIHRGEYAIYLQAISIRTEEVQAQGLFRTVFSRTRYSHRANFVGIEGEFPFRPHKLLGFNPILSVALMHEDTSEWSSGLDAIKGDFDIGEMTISINCLPAPSSSLSSNPSTSEKRMSRTPTGPNSGPSFAALSTLHEFGAFIERGQGLLQNTTTVTLVPKHVLVSKLSYPIDLRLIPVQGVWPTVISLAANSTKSYHFTTKNKIKLLHMRRAVTLPIPTHIEQDSNSFVGDTSWVGEIDICTIGIVYIKLRNPLKIIKVETEIIGASFIASFEEQDLIWPPYRISNMTEHPIRYRQNIPDNYYSFLSAGVDNIISGIMSVPSKLVGDDSASSNSSANSSVDYSAKGLTSSGSGTALPAMETLPTVGSSNTVTDDEGLIPWDYLQPGECSSYSWDLPLTGSKLLHLEVKQGTQWVKKVVGLDDDSKIETAALKRAVPNLGNPLAEGHLFKQETFGDSWSKVYCILRPDILYIYSDETRNHLLEVVAMSTCTDQGPKFSLVTKYTGKSWDLIGTIQSSVGFLGSVVGVVSKSSSGSGGMKYDTNSVRLMLLRVATYMGLLANCSIETFNVARRGGRRRRGGDDEDDDEDDLMDDGISAENVLAKKTKSKEFDDATSDLPPVDDESANAIQSLEERQDNQIPATLDHAAAAILHEQHLIELLKAGVSVEQLLNEIANYPLRMEDFLNVIQLMGEVSNDEKAIEICEWMIAENILSEHGSLGDGEGGESDFDLSFDGKKDPFHSVDSDDEPSDEEYDERDDKVGSLVALGENQKIKNRMSLSPSRRATNNRMPLTQTMPASSRQTAVRESMSFQLPTASMSGTAGASNAAKKMASKRAAFLQCFEDTELFFNPPPLNPELFASVSTGAGMANMRMSLSGNVGPNNQVEEIFGFSILLPSGSKYHFKCVSEMEFFGWIQSCRQSIELAWIDYKLQRKTKDTYVPKIEDFQSTVLMKVRPDGSTKVLEIIEDDTISGDSSRISSIVAKSSKFVSNALKRGKKNGANSPTKTVKKTHASSILPLFSKSRRLFASNGTAAAEEATSGTEIDQDEQLISVFFTVEGVALSIMDVTPMEVAYFRLQDIDMSVVRYFDAVQFSVTVKEIQMSAQMLHSTFPVALTARRIEIDHGEGSGQPTNGVSPVRIPRTKFSLPGLDTTNLAVVPALHLNLQQRYHHLSRKYRQQLQQQEEIGGENSKKKTAPKKKDGSKLWYFDSFTLWLAPMNLGLDEELIVKMLRFVHALKTTMNAAEGESSKVRKLREDSSYHTSNSNSSATGGGSANQSSGGASGASNDNNASSGGVFDEQTDSRWLLHRDLLSQASVYEAYREFSLAGKLPYLTFRQVNHKSKLINLYFNVLQLYPLDFTLHFRTSPDLQITNSEHALITIISQLDGARLRLNALIAENAYGSTTIISDILVKHYRASFWKQFHRLIGAADFVDESVGLVANLGSGVYDLFYEPIDGLIDDNSTFLQGLSKGGASLASRAIGGTSAITSKITGGIGKGVSLLTLDSEFQRNRNYRRYNKANTVAEGLFVGTQELGKNIVEGVTGIVVSPYRGWEQGGGVGFGVGVAKGILGVALKPAVGVLDLASRATEGIRNTALTNNDQEMNLLLQSLHRARLPRAFGRSGQLILYDQYAAAAQFIADDLYTAALYASGGVGVVSSSAAASMSRFFVISHLYTKRRIIDSPLYNALFLQSRARVYGSMVNNPSNGVNTGTNSGKEDIDLALVSQSPNLFFVAEWMQKQGSYGEAVMQEFAGPCREAWGMARDNFYLVLVSADRISLVLMTHTTGSSSTNTNPVSASEGSNNVTSATGHAAVVYTNVKKTIERKLIWTCPAVCIDQFFSDSRGDLVLSVCQPVHITGSAWNNIAAATAAGAPNAAANAGTNAASTMVNPIIVDLDAQNYLVFQSLLEQTIGHHFARQQPLHPWKGIIQSNIRKIYASGIRSYLLAPSNHTYRLFGNVLYEYTAIKRSTKAQAAVIAAATAKGEDNPDGQGIKDIQVATNSEEYAEKLIGQLFSPKKFKENKTSRAIVELAEGEGDQITTHLLRDHYLSFIYPLVDLYIVGPSPEEGGKFSITLNRLDSQKMRTLKRDDEGELFSEYAKNGLSLLFDTMDNAMLWKNKLSSHILLQPLDVLPLAPLTAEERKKAMRSTVIGSVTGANTRREEMVLFEDNSILGSLVLPTSGCDPEETERIKIEIAKTLSTIRR